jgi:hypothetical protein
MLILSVAIAFSLIVVGCYSNDARMTRWPLRCRPPLLLHQVWGLDRFHGSSQTVRQHVPSGDPATATAGRTRRPRAQIEPTHGILRTCPILMSRGSVIPLSVWRAFTVVWNRAAMPLSVSPALTRYVRFAAPGGGLTGESVWGADVAGATEPETDGSGVGPWGGDVTSGVGATDAGASAVAVAPTADRVADAAGDAAI